MNYYKTSVGEHIAKSVIDRKIREAKRLKIEKMIEQYGYVFCEECGRNASTGVPLDCSHNISVDEAQKIGRSELAWDVDNITIRCRYCHRKYDHTNLQFSKRSVGPYLSNPLLQLPCCPPFLCKKEE